MHVVHSRPRVEFGQVAVAQSFSFFFLFKFLVHLCDTRLAYPMMESSGAESDVMSVESTTPRSLSPTWFSPSPSPSLSTTQTAGRPRKCAVWDYFNYDSTNNKSVCQVVINISAQSRASSPDLSPTTPSVCGHRISGKFPTNMKSHLKTSHPNIFKEFQLKEETLKKIESVSKAKAEKKRSGPAVSTQRTLGEVMQRKYRDSTKWQYVTKGWQCLLLVATFPIRLLRIQSFSIWLKP